jgi:hypothetical protein
MCLQIRRTFKYLDVHSLRKLIVTFIRPLLEYCNSIWSPILKSDCDALEKVQKLATRLLPSIQNKPYEERLQAMRILSLADRRRRGDLIEVFKIINNKYDVNPADFFEVDMQSRHAPFLKLRKTKTRARHHFFTQRTVTQWNALPSEVKNDKSPVCSVNVFKNKLDIYKGWSFKIPTTESTLEVNSSE